MNNTRKQLTDKEKEIIELMHKQGKSQREIARTINRNRTTIGRYFRDNELKTKVGVFSIEEENIILKMRGQGESYDKIANVLNCEKKKVGDYCRSIGLGGYRKANYNIDPFGKFISEFNLRFSSRFEYISGYKNNKSYIVLKCKTCNKQFDRHGGFISQNKNVRCPHCYKGEINEKKSILQKEEKRKGLTLRIKRMKTRIERSLKQLERLKSCEDCSSLFKARTSSNTRCKSCSRKRNNRAKELRKRKLKENGDIDYSISLEKLIRKEKNVCYLCRGQCDSSDFTVDDGGSFIVGPNYPSIEHVHPVSKGGTHTWDNVKLAHHYCNTIKSDNELGVE